MPGARVGRADTSRCRSERDVARGDADYRLGLLARRLDDPPEAVRAPAETLLALRDALMERISDLTPTRLQSVKTRCHGNLHLGHILVVENDLVDVAGIVRSFDRSPARPWSSCAGTTRQSRSG